MKTYQHIKDRVKTAREADRICFAAPNLRHLEITAKRILRGDTRSKAEETKLIRLKRAESENPGKGTPLELFDNETCSLFGYSNGSDGRAVVREIITIGEALGLWISVPRPERAARRTAKKDLRPHLLFLNDWPHEPIIETGETPKALVNALHREEADERTSRELIKTRAAQGRLLAAHEDISDTYDFPSNDTLTSGGKELVTLGLTKKGLPKALRAEHDTAKHPDIIKAHTYTFGETPGQPNIQDRIEEFDQQRYRKTVSGEASKTENFAKDFEARLYTPTNQIAKWIREHFTSDGEEMVHADFKALHPNLLARIIHLTNGNAPDFLTGDSHSKIAELLNIPRGEAKLINLTFWNMNKVWFEKRFAAGGKPKPDDFLFIFFTHLKTKHPEFLETLDAINRSHRFEKTCDRLHANLSHLMFHRETQLMAKVSKALTEQGILHDPVHDAVFVRKSQITEVLATMDKIAKTNGIMTTASMSETVKDGLARKLFEQGAGKRADRQSVCD